MRPVVLSIAGSDSSCGAGIQLDLRVIEYLGCRPVSVISVVTAQELAQVNSIMAVSERLLNVQLDTALSGTHSIASCKLGMQSLQSIKVIEASSLFSKVPHVVLDPVLSSTSGFEFIAAEDIIPLARKVSLITPNSLELGAMLGVGISSLEELRSAGMELSRMLSGVPVLAKGGHVNERSVDVFISAEGAAEFLEAQKIELKCEVRGTGCFLSSAIAACLAQGKSLRSAIVESKEELSRQLLRAEQIGEIGVFKFH